MLKPMQLAYSLEAVLAEIPKLPHGTDGFIYTAVNSRYIPQTDDGM
jgi:mRNA guanylyltransferase